MGFESRQEIMKSKSSGYWDKDKMKYIIELLKYFKSEFNC